MNALAPQIRALVGSFRRFGTAGPVYEITGYAAPNSAGDPMIRIHVFDSGEDADYKMSDAVEDPVAD